jgi:16S rRNA G527 N7-methylase RsmG
VPELSWVAGFESQVVAWDKVHRIVGKTSPAQLMAEAIEGLAATVASKSISLDHCLVDVGAGAGFLGLAWVLGLGGASAIFVEPDLKKAAFLRGYLATLIQNGQFTVFDRPIEQVSRETLVKLSNSKFILAARAFSGARSLEGALSLGGFSGDACYKFEKSGLVPLQFI